MTMEDSKKKPIMIAVIILCLGIAGAVFFMGGGSGGGTIDDIPDDKMVWVKCNNPQCKAEYEMGEKAYYKAVQERMDPRALATPALICETCGKASVYKAEKCANSECGVVFFSGSVPNDFADRCPECGKSETEEIRKRRKSGGS
jgi:hypothetical protein